MYKFLKLIIVIVYRTAAVAVDENLFRMYNGHICYVLGNTCCKKFPPKQSQWKDLSRSKLNIILIETNKQD